MDADVYGPSIPHMLGVEGARPAAVELRGEGGQPVQRIEPIDAGGVKVISMGFFVEPEKAVVWRGPMLHRAITQFLSQTDWGELDYLIIDMPPGTGDVSLTLSQTVGLAGAVVVCTPQQVALLDAVKAISMFRQVNIPVLGIVENMSGDIFGRGGAKKKAAELGVPFLGEVPIEADIRIKGDDGAIAALFAEGSPARPHLLNVCERTAIEIAKQLLETPTMPTLEIL
jgi:ATP-binding protein involved in chromosome partitioning